MCENLGNNFLIYPRVEFCPFCEFSVSRFLVHVWHVRLASVLPASSTPAAATNPGPTSPHWPCFPSSGASPLGPNNDPIWPDSSFTGCQQQQTDACVSSDISNLQPLLPALTGPPQGCRVPAPQATPSFCPWRPWEEKTASFCHQVLRLVYINLIMMRD